MKYIGEFLSIDDRAYKIEISNTKSGGDTKIVLGGTPFVVNYTSEDKHIYTPIRSGGATITIVSDSYNFNLYTGASQGVKVTFTETTNNMNVVRWVGYVTPTLYTQGFDKYLEEIEVDCVDGIAVLKDIPYRSEGEHTISTFGDIILRCLKQSGCYKNFYITDNVQLTATASDSIIEKLRISQANFFDEKKDINQTDDDVAWSCYDVLYEICQFLGYTLFADGEDVYIVDYDAIKAGNNKYFKYSLSGTSLGNSTTETKSFSKHIDENAYSANGTTISLDEVYNKITVKDEFQTFDSLFPNFGDINMENNITAPTDPNFKNMFIYSDGSASNCGTGSYQFGDVIQQNTKNGKVDNYYVFVCGVYRDNLMLYVMKFYDSHIFNFHKYVKDRAAGFPENKDENLWGIGNFRWSNMINYNGAFYYRYWKRDISRDEYNKWWLENVNNKNYWNLSNSERKAIWEKLINSNGKIDFTNCISFINDSSAQNKHIGPNDGKDLNSRNGAANYPYTEEGLKYPYVTMKSGTDASIFGGLDASLRITGKLIYHDDWKVPFPMSDGASNGKLKREGDYKYGDEGFIWCRLKFGMLYWDGERWTNDLTWFKLHIWSDNTRDREARKNKNIYDKEFQIINYVTSRKNDLKDVVIPVPDEGNLEGSIEVSLATRDMYGDSKRSHWGRKNNFGENGYTRYYSGVWVIKDLNIVAEINDGSASEDTDSDTIYTNVIDNGAVQKMDEITFKICTYDGKKPNYSSVDYLHVTGVGNTVYSTYITTLYNKALRNLESGSAGCDGKNDGGLRQEEHYIFKLATQYEEPRIIFEVNLHNEDHKLYGIYTDKTVSGKKFIPTEMTVDYKFNTTNIKLCEKF